MDLKALRSDFHVQFLGFKSINYLINTEGFEVAFTNATDEERKKIISAIRAGNRDIIKIFIDNRNLNYEEMSVRKLRVLGQNLRVEHYESLTKDNLIKGIKNAVQRIKEKASRVSNQPKQETRPRIIEICVGGGQPPVLVAESNRACA